MQKRWFIFCGDSILLRADNTLPEAATPPLQQEAGNMTFELHDKAGSSYGAYALSVPPKDWHGTAVPLRKSYALLPTEEYQLAGKARELIYWDAQTHFCGVCGSPMRRDTEISKRCTCCGKEVWPSLAIAVIVAVSRNNELLLVKAKTFRRDYMGLVAGFVETGETLEQSVCREVMEETGLEIKNLKYFASQPWPFPSGLMVGFTADYAGGTLKLQRSELAKGGWYTVGEVEQTPIPGKESIARSLIDDWLKKHKD